jgi:hypothetical protein
MRADTDGDDQPIVVLDLIMPRGRRLRDCTVTEMKNFCELLSAQMLSAPAGLSADLLATNNPVEQRGSEMRSRFTRGQGGK